MDVLAPGSKVMIGEHLQTRAIVDRVCIGRGDVVQYEVSYWDDNQKCLLIMNDDELDSVDGAATMNVKLSLQ